MSFLVGKDLSGGYGGPDILKGCNIEVDKGEVAVIVGPNGAGKSTAMKAFLGMLQMTGGSITLGDKDIMAMTPQQRVIAGIGFVPQTHNVFTGMTVEENLEMGAFIRNDDISDTIEEIYALFPILKQKRLQAAGELSGGQQQMLAMGRALMAKPRLLLLDEPSMGLAPLIIEEIFNIVKELKEEGITIFLVEQNASQALALADRGYVLETGKVVIEGTGQELLSNEKVREAYLGM